MSAASDTSESPRGEPAADAPDRNGPRLIRTLTLKNLLSFGPDSPPLPLQSLNVLIGPNGSGKSNVLEALALLRSAPVDFRDVVSRGGGVTEWIWKGDLGGIATIDAMIDNPLGNEPLRHAVQFRKGQQAFQLFHEQVENQQHPLGTQRRCVYEGGESAHSIYVAGGPGGVLHDMMRGQIQRDLSILAQRRDPELYPEITYLAEVYGKIRLYRDWQFGRHAVFRQPQRADLRNDRLEEDFSNLGLFLNRLRRSPPAKWALLEGLRNLYDGLTDFDVSVEGGTVQVYFTEGPYTIPAVRLSDGSLRYLCLLAVLCDPQPPPLIGIEEPELGLHPDLLPKLADLLVSAAQRCQLIVTTHSDILVDALSERPESIVVCEKHAGQSALKRLDPEELRPWLEKYRLGQLWTRGEIGGTRW